MTEFKSFKKWLNESKGIDENQLKKWIIEYYETNSNIDYSDSLELTWDPSYKLYWAWVAPYNNNHVYKEKTGLSESNAKKNFILASNTLKKNDPAGWKEHEIGHILGYREGYYKKKGNIIDTKEVYGLNEYPNVWSEFIPFTRQMKFLSQENNPKSIIRFMMKHYEECSNNIEQLKKIEEFFIKLYEKEVKNIDLKNKYA